MPRLWSGAAAFALAPALREMRLVPPEAPQDEGAVPRLLSPAAVLVLLRGLLEVQVVLRAAPEGALLDLILPALLGGLSLVVFMAWVFLRLHALERKALNLHRRSQIMQQWVELLDADVDELQKLLPRGGRRRESTPGGIPPGGGGAGARARDSQF